MRNRRDKRNPNKKPKIIKSMPLSLAVVALSSGAVFASVDYDEIHVYDNNGIVINKIIMAQMNDQNYANAARASVKSAFLAYDKILLHNSTQNLWANLNQFNVDSALDNMWYY